MTTCHNRSPYHRVTVGPMQIKFSTQIETYLTHALHTSQQLSEQVSRLKAKFKIHVRTTSNKYKTPTPNVNNLPDKVS